MNNSVYENRRYNTKRIGALTLTAAVISVLMETVAEHKTKIKIALATAVIALFFGVFGGVETGLISAAVGFSVCAAIALFGIIFCGEK